MRATEFIVETAMMGKIADSGKIIRILKKAHTVPFSDEKNWLLVDTDPGKGNSGLGIKWIPADTRFEWVRPYRDTVDENLSPQTIHKLADRKGVKWDNEPSFLQLTKRLTGKEHLDDLDHSGLNKVKRHLDGLQGVTEEVNSEILSTKNSLPTEKISMGDYEFNAQIYTGELGNPGLQIRAYDPKLRQGIQQIGNADFVVHTDEKGNTWLESDDTAVRPSYYGKGVAAMMYAFAKSLGNDIKPSPYQEPPGKKMWKKWGKDAKNLVGEQGVAEGQDDKAEAYRAHLIKTLPQIMKLFANIGKGWIPSKEQMLSAVDTAYRVMKHTGDVKQAGKVLMDELNTLYRMSQGKQGVAEGIAETLQQQLAENLNVDVPNEEWLQNAIDYAIQKSPDRNGLPYMGKTTATARPVEVSVSILKRIPGMRREQSNVRHRDLAAIRKIMHTTGKLPLHTQTQEEYKPFINVAYDGSAWVNEGNHRIMAAAELGWPSLPVEISYFDGGERVESGAMYPGKIGLA